MTTTNSDGVLPAQGIAAPRSGRIDPKYLRSSLSSGSFEMLAWLFMRLSGVALVVLIFVHLWVNLMVGNGIHQVDFGFVAGKWANPVWRFWDLTMLWLAMLHGTNGMRTIINDYAEKDCHAPVAEGHSLPLHSRDHRAGHSGDLHLRSMHGRCQRQSAQ